MTIKRRTVKLNEIVCKECGKPGREWPNDPAPNLCPDCLEMRMARATAELEKTPTFARAAELLRDVGLTQRAIDKFLRGELPL